ncbi:DUF2621 family protein [Variovorax guangxiensis]|uniref:DUF2621 family protein n=1 Tax=Variovorax guangxiensis TaxID=1775474 RepID=A0A433MTY0_9BURK|nr:DUF2621 family protein [Variovorax guangxiensis]RUR71242.1 DUF2621 family protein [Variovorax guangxiensis]
MNQALVVFGVSHVQLPVSSVNRSKSLYGGVLGFETRDEGAGWCELDAGGTISLLLVESEQTDQRACLRLLAADVSATLEALLLRGGCRLINDATRTAEMTLTASVCDADGHLLVVWRKLTEDEYDVVPELPKALPWHDDADALLKQLLKSVPALFRGIARRKIVRVVEELAVNHRIVMREEVIRGFILASPRITRERNRQPLIAAGIDVHRYQDDWNAD